MTNWLTKLERIKVVLVGGKFCVSAQSLNIFLKLRKQAGSRLQKANNGGRVLGEGLGERKGRLTDAAGEEAGADRELLTLLKVDSYKKGPKLKF